MRHIFISYSRKDMAFAQRIVDALAALSLDTWIDWKSIPKGEDWEQEIYRGIEEADAFLFLISPDSAASVMCSKEIAHAVKNGKRILPIVLRDTGLQIIHPEIAKRNWIFCRDGLDDFASAVGETQKTIQVDYQWVKFHTELQVKAVRWEQGKDNSRLLRGNELREAEVHLSAAMSREPGFTEIQKKYLRESRRRSHQTGILLLFIGTALLLLVALAVAGTFNRFIYRPLDMENYWVAIPAGGFQMGSSESQIAYAQTQCREHNEQNCEFASLNETPAQTVEVGAFEIGRYEVTNRQYQQCAKAGACAGASTVGADMDLHPVFNVTWYDAQDYCNWIGGRLPTEAEWEKAARGTDGNIFPWGDNAPTDELLNYRFNNGRTTPVGQYPGGASPYGLFDMAGNVQEWTNSLYEAYPYDANDGREKLVSSNNRTLRGGSWDSDGDYINLVRTTSRYAAAPDMAFYYIGFRCARSSTMPAP